MRVLILGGTGESHQLVAMLANAPGLDIILSLAGRTSRPLIPSCAVRIGGFGGVEGLASYLECECIDIVADVTHPFATRISAHAVSACAMAMVKLARFERAAFISQPGDNWHLFPTLSGLAAALAGPPRRILLTHGREGLDLFAMHTQHDYLVRTIEPPPHFEVLAKAQLILARGPFLLADELKLMGDHAIDTLVSKDSGGAATSAKIAAARQLGVEVFLLARPGKAEALTFTELAPLAAWIRSHDCAS